MLARIHARRDDGSILLSFLALLVISGLLIAIAATVVSGENQDRFDRSYERALLLAEDGHSRIASLIQANPVQTAEQLVANASPEFTADATGGTPLVATPYLRATETDGAYAVRATKTETRVGPVLTIRWVLDAEGTALDGRVRRIQSELVIRPLFGLAAFGKTVMRMNGDNYADSFYSYPGTGAAPQGTDLCLLGAATPVSVGTPTSVDSNLVEINMCSTTDRGFGTVATNGRLDLQGNTTPSVDVMEVHSAREHVTDPIPNATGYCDGPKCETSRADGSLTFFREPIELPPTQACDLGPTSVPADYGSGAVFGGSVYDVQNLVLDGTTQIQGTDAAPTVLCVRGNLTVAAGQMVNFQNAGTAESPRWVPRRPGTLYIFVTGDSNSTISFENHTMLSAAVYAPNSVISCAAQGNIFGSMVANDINCQGGFRFHFDRALGESITYPSVRAENWREITG